MPDDPNAPPNINDLTAAIESYFPQSEWGTAEAIISRESGWDSTAVNNTSRPDLPGYNAPAPGNLPEYSVGLFQINTDAWPDVAQMFDLTDPIQNIQAAAYIQAHNGWSPWGGAPNTGGSGGGGGSSGGGSGAGSSGGTGAGSGGGGNTGGGSLGGGATTQQGVLSQIGELVQRLSDFLAYFEVNLAQALLRLLLVLIGLALVIVGLMFFMQSLSG
jgi:hypothetical protein